MRRTRPRSTRPSTSRSRSGKACARISRTSCWRWRAAGASRRAMSRAISSPSANADDRSAADATHAWVEALHAGVRLGRLRSDEQHARLASATSASRSGATTTTCRRRAGVFKGPANSELAVAVTVTPTRAPAGTRISCASCGRCAPSAARRSTRAPAPKPSISRNSSSNNGDASLGYLDARSRTTVSLIRPLACVGKGVKREPEPAHGLGSRQALGLRTRLLTNHGKRSVPSAGHTVPMVRSHASVPTAPASAPAAVGAEITKIERRAQGRVVVERVLEIEIGEVVELGAEALARAFEIGRAVAVLQVDEAHLVCLQHRPPVVDGTEILRPRAARHHAAPADADIRTGTQVFEPLRQKATRAGSAFKCGRSIGNDAREGRRKRSVLPQVVK